MSYFLSLLLHIFFKKLTEDTVVDDNGVWNVGEFEWTIMGPLSLYNIWIICMPNLRKRNYFDPEIQMSKIQIAGIQMIEIQIAEIQI